VRPAAAFGARRPVDDPKSKTPSREIFCDDGLCWVQTIGDMRRFAKRPA
jgi:hypothetical protein